MPSARRCWSVVLALVVTFAAAYAAGCGSGEGAGGSSLDGGGNGDGTVTGDGGGLNLDTGAGNGDAGTTNGDGAGGGGGGGPNNCTPPSSLAISPADKVVNVDIHGTFTQAYTVTATYPGQPSADVTSSSFFTASDPNVGSFSGATFTWSGQFGGKITISATSCGVVATTSLSLVLGGALGSTDAGLPEGGDAGTIIDPNQAANQFTGSPTSVAACNPTLVYPPDGVLLPPNTNVIEVHFLEGSPGNSLFEISFTNAVTDIKIYTACNATAPAYGQPMNGGCVFELDQAEWDFIAKTNRDGDPVTVKVRGVGCDGTNVGASNTRKISFAKEPVVGTLYYWASMRIGASAFSGGVFRYDFGVRGQSAEPVLTPTYPPPPGKDAGAAISGGLCIGCHDISRDGRKMLFDYDDNNADDEYTDVNTDIFDIASRSFATLPDGGTLSKGNAFEPGFHTWNRSHSKFLLSDGANCTPTNNAKDCTRAKPNGSFTVMREDAGLVGFTPAVTDAGTAPRGTTPDWAPDDSKVVFAGAPNVAGGPLPDGGSTQGFWAPNNDPKEDLFFSGASLYVSSWTDSTNQLSWAPTLLVGSNGTTNYYYPSYSPDGSLIIFNYAPDGPNFHNPKARVQLVAAGQASPTPDDLALLNNDTTNGGLVTNSWARWAPFVQSYKNEQILWVTTSSTRSYGLRINNEGTQNCYPVESPTGAPYSTRDFTTTNLNPACSRAQLWMAAIKLDANAVASGQDVSWPAFWLPFQDLTTNNHLGQWSQRSYTGTCTVGVDSGAGACAPGFCCDNGGCTPCQSAPPPPPATCSVDANCANGTCCNGGQCGACAGWDGGSSSGGGSSGGASSGGSGSSGGGGCQTCLDCNGQACVASQCGGCTNSAQCCAPLTCQSGRCLNIPQ